jgi:hypothetical protein
MASYLFPQTRSFGLDVRRRILSEYKKIMQVLPTTRFTRLRTWLLASVLLLALSSPMVRPSVTAAEEGEPLPVKVLEPPSMDHPPVAEGIVYRYLLTPRGDVNGLLLRDGSQMHVTLRAEQDLTKNIQPGDHVRVHGRRVSDSPLIRADVIVNVTDGRSFTVPYRLDLPMPPREVRPSVNEMRAVGTIEVLLYDPQGVVNGALLSDGTQVRLPPDVGEHFHASLQKDMDVEVRGYGAATPHGSALEATAIGRKGQPLTHLDASTQQLR